MTDTPPHVSKGVHPCRCRGNSDVFECRFHVEGSSLPVQGQPFVRGSDHPMLGFIPAGAGATECLCSRGRRSWVHPCRCRGNFVVRAQCPPRQGSSLPVQGQRLWGVGMSDVRGFIPAGAGATAGMKGVILPEGVHPCRCRGNSASSSVSCLPWGSSLPVQGQRLFLRAGE